MEVGPLARWVIGYAQGKPEFKEPVEKVLTDLGLPVTALFSTLGRTAARGLEAQWAARPDALLPGQADRQPSRPATLATANTDKWEPGDLAGRGQGRRLHRGAARRARPLDQDQGHQDRQLPVHRADDLERLARAIRKGNIGAFEASLMNTPMADPKQPLEIIRTLHSFDPVPRLLDACDEPGRAGNGEGRRCAEGARR